MDQNFLKINFVVCYEDFLEYFAADQFYDDV
jgi:hypothetical protein